MDGLMIERCVCVENRMNLGFEKKRTEEGGREGGRQI